MRGRFKGLKVLCVLLAVMLMLNYVVYADMGNSGGGTREGINDSYDLGNINNASSNGANANSAVETGGSQAAEKDEADTANDVIEDTDGSGDRESTNDQDAAGDLNTGADGNDPDQDSGSKGDAGDGQGGTDVPGETDPSGGTDTPEEPDDPDQPNVPDEDAAYGWYTADPQAESFSLKNKDELIEFAELVNGTSKSEEVDGPVDFAGKTIELQNDADLAGVEWTSIGNTEDKAFKGCFNGNMHVIENLTMKEGVSHGGLFGYMYGEVKNAMIKNCNIYSDFYAGGIAAVANGSIVFCSAEGTVISEHGSEGGIVGRADNARIKSSFSAVNMKAVKAAELTGEGTAEISGSYMLVSEDDIDGDGDADEDEDGSEEPSLKTEENDENDSDKDIDKPEAPEVPEIPDTADVRQKTAAAFASGEVSWLMNTVGGVEENHAVWSCDGVMPIYANDTNKPVYRVIACSDAVGGSVAADKIYLCAGEEINVSYTVDEGYRLREYALSYGGGTVFSPASGKVIMPSADTELRGVFVRIAESTDASRDWYLNNKESSYYFLENENELVGLAQIVNGTAPECDTAYDFTGKTIILLSDLNFTLRDDMQPIGSSSAAPFAGTFDFNGCSVKNLTIKSEGNYSGIFGYLTGSVQNLNADGVYITGNKYCGIIAGYSSGSITSCSASGSVDGTEYAGGIVGYNDGSITKAVNSARVSGESYVGGITGQNAGTIALSYSRSAITADNVYGGIAGVNTETGVITDSYTVSFINNGSDNSVADETSAGTVKNTYYVKETVKDPDESSKDEGSYNKEEASESGGTTDGTVSDDENSSAGGDDKDPAESDKTLGEARSRAQFYSGEVSWLLNTFGGEKKNSGVWSVSDKGPIFADQDNAPIYRIFIDHDGNYGKVICSNLYVKSGSVVRPDVTLESGCRVKLFKITSDGKDVSFKTDYSFEMPDADVIISAAFYKVDEGKANSKMKVSFYYKDAGLPEDFNIPVQSIIYGMTAVEPEIPSIEGVIIEGWYEGYMNANGNVSFGQKFDFKTAITDDIVLYLKWHNANAYAVTFIDNINKDGSDGKADDAGRTEYIVEGELIPEPEAPLWDDKHIFNFWSHENSLSGKIWNFKEDRMPATDIVLYAQWSILDMDFAEAGGTGTANDPYKISSAKYMHLLSKKVMAGNTYEGTFFKLMNDITIGIAPKDDKKDGGNDHDDGADDKDIEEDPDKDPSGSDDSGKSDSTEEDQNEWIPIGIISRPFQGNFQGDDKNISIYCINDPETAGTFASFKGIFGYLGENAEVSNINVTGKVSGYQYVGAVAGKNDGTISQCTNRAVIEVKETGGGIAGSNKGKITKCVNAASLRSTKAYLGGIVGMSEGTVSECTNDTDIVIEGLEHTGGIAGSSKGRIEKCNNLASINGSVKYVGGIAGEGNVTNSQNEGVITGKEDANYIAGITGNGVVSWCSNKGNVTGVNYIGGIAGAGTVINSYNTADIKASGGSAGGVVGQSVSVSFCYNTGNVYTVTDYAGGVAGAGPVSDCFNYGKIETESTGQYFGQLTGIGNKSNSYFLSKTETPYGGKTADSFASGEVAWLLNTAGGKEDNIGFWSNNDEHPIISDAENGPVYAAIVEGGTNGSIDINNQNIIYGKSTDEIKVKINAHPDHGYKLSYVIINDERADTSFEMGESDLYISAVFEEDTKVVERPSSSGGSKHVKTETPKPEIPGDFIGTGGGSNGGDGTGSGEEGTGTGNDPLGTNDVISGTDEVNAAETSESPSVTNEPETEKTDTVLSSDNVEPEEKIAEAAQGASGGNGNVIKEETRPEPKVTALKSVTVKDVVSDPIIWILLGVMLAAALIWRYVRYRREK